MKIIACALALVALPAISHAACLARDFLTIPLPATAERAPEAVALEIAFPGLVVDEGQGTVTVGDALLSLGRDTGRPESERFKDPTILEQFIQVYPLDFDLSRRLTPWHDPGRARNQALLRALYGNSKAAVAAKLMRVEYRNGQRKARFLANTRQCVAQQLQAALDGIASQGPEMNIFFQKIGGSFNWRVIAGTKRLSAHSFGIAVDFNTELGGYWRWSGATEGNVGPFKNRYPEALVRQMERYGFIWGGKWHHFDAMHFEYRPDLIVHARLMGAGIGN